MCVVGFAVVKSSGGDLKQSVTNIYNAGQLRTEIIRIRSALGSFVLVNERLAAPLTNVTEATTRANMRVAVESGFELHKKLYLQMSSVGADLERLYAENTLDIERFVAGSVIESPVNLWDGINTLLAAASRLLETRVADFTNTHPDVFVIEQNSSYDDDVFQALMTVIILYQKQAERNTQSVVQTQAILMAVAIGVLMVIVLFVFPPVVRHVNRTANRVFELFLDINPIQIIEIAKSREEVLVTLGVGSETGGKHAR